MAARAPAKGMGVAVKVAISLPDSCLLVNMVLRRKLRGKLRCQDAQKDELCGRKDPQRNEAG